MKKRQISSKQKIYDYVFRKRLLKAIILVLLVFLILLGVFFYFFEQSSYQKNLKKNTDALAFQIAATSEMVFRNIKDTISRTVLYDTSAFTLSQKYRETRSGKLQILNMLRSLSIANEHIHSSYLYYLEDQIVYTSQSAPATIVPFGAFNDAYAYSKVFEKDTYALPPRLLTTRNTSLNNNQLPLAVTLVTGAPASSVTKSSYLAVNVDMEGLFSTLFRKMQIDESINFYILAKDEQYPEGELTVIYHKDRSKIFSRMPHPSSTQSDRTAIVSTYHSDILNWEFVIENWVEPVRGDILKRFALLFLFLLFIFLVMILLLIYYTIPINKMATNAQNAHWRELLTSNHTEYLDFAEEIMQFSAGENFSDYSRFGVVSVIVPNKGTLLGAHSQRMYELAQSLFGKYKERFAYQIVNISAHNLLLVVAFNEKDNSACFNELQLFSYTLLDNYQNDLLNDVICCIGSIKKEINLLPLAYKETLSVQNYKYLLNSPVLAYNKIMVREEPYVFPVEYERQLINNLVVGNYEGCMQYLDKIFSSFFLDDHTLRDDDINQYLYLMLNNIMRRLLSLPMSIQSSYQIDYKNQGSLAELREELDCFIDSVIETINAQGGDDSLALGNCIVGYITTNFSDAAIDLQTISEEFSLNKNYVSRIIKERTGKSFPEYINDCRIEKSKLLLKTTDLTIKEIAETIGFTYSYYFIRVFKQSQGITPGEYKKINKKS